MLRIVVFYVLPIILCVYCLVHAITTRDDEVRNLPKVAWILLILFFPVIGSIAWLAAGQPRADRPRAYERPATAFPEYDRPGRAAATSAEADDEFLKRVRERAEEQRRAYEEKKRREAAEQARAEAERKARRKQAEGGAPGTDPDTPPADS